MSGATLSNVELDPRVARNQAVDALKGIAIIGVLMIHSVTRQMLHDAHAYFHIWQAVPVLIVLMGFTGATARLRPLPEYFRRRAVRLLPAFVVIWIVSLVLTVLWTRTLAWDPTWLVGGLPTRGPGNYFVTLIVGFTLILPVLRWVLARWGEWALFLFALGVNAGYEVLAGLAGWDNYLYQSSVLRMLFMIALGMLLARGWKVWLLLPGAMVYLLAIDRGIVMPLLIGQGQTQALFSAGLAAALVAWGLKADYPGWLGSIGRASYHMFLVQIVWFGQVVPRFRSPDGAWPFWMAVSVAACVVLGLLAHRAEESVLRRAALY